MRDPGGDPDEPAMAVQAPSRRRLRPGDIFTMRYPDVGFVFGRVIDVNLPVGPCGPGSNLIYVYSHVAREPDARTALDEGHLRPGHLLFGPVIINRLRWSRGYFQTVLHQDLDDRDRLSRHCFFDPAFRVHRALDGDEVAPSVPDRECGVWGLDSYRTVDLRICHALPVRH